MNRSQSPLHIFLDGAVANGAGKVMLVEDFKHLVLSLDTASNAAGKISIQGSVAEEPPTFGSAQSPTNQWDYVEVIDLEDGSAIDGDTGITLSGTDDHRQLEVNVNMLRWVTVIISSYSAGAWTVKGRASSN